MEPFRQKIFYGIVKHLYFLKSDPHNSSPSINFMGSENMCVCKFIYILDGQRVSQFSANFHFWVNYSFVQKCTFK